MSSESARSAAIHGSPIATKRDAETDAQTIARHAWSKPTEAAATNGEDAQAESGDHPHEGQHQYRPSVQIGFIERPRQEHHHAEHRCRHGGGDGQPSGKLVKGVGGDGDGHEPGRERQDSQCLAHGDVRPTGGEMVKLPRAASANRW